MAGAKPPMETGGAKENRTYQESSNDADYRKRTAAGETVQICLMAVDDDKHRKDPEAESQGDQTHSSRDPLQGLSAEEPVGRYGFRLWCSECPNIARYESR